MKNIFFKRKQEKKNKTAVYETSFETRPHADRCVDDIRKSETDAAGEKQQDRGMNLCFVIHCLPCSHPLNQGVLKTEVLSDND